MGSRLCWVGVGEVCMEEWDHVLLPDFGGFPVKNVIWGCLKGHSIQVAFLRDQGKNFM